MEIYGKSVKICRVKLKMGMEPVTRIISIYNEYRQL